MRVKSFRNSHLLLCSHHAIVFSGMPQASFPSQAHCHLSERAVDGDIFASRLWYAVTAAHALPAGTLPIEATAAGSWLALRRDGRALASLTTPYSQAWSPLGLTAANAASAGRELARLWRGSPPGRLEALDPALPNLEPFLGGLRAGGLAALRYDHVGQWHEAFDPAMTWPAYLACRPTQLQNTIRRKLARAGREFALSVLTAPGDPLDAAILDFEAVRARSWKPDEPFPAFDAALMRAAAAEGALRLGLLRSQADGRPVAAQYWLLDHGGQAGRRRAIVPKLFHDETARAASPGTALTAMMLRALIEQDGVRELDFGRGDDAYKQLWVATRRSRIGVVLADPRHPAGLLAIARHAAGAIRRRWRAAPA